MTFNNKQNVRDEKFNKYAFFVAFGVSKMIDQKWGKLKFLMRLRLARNWQISNGIIIP